jgi:hypothetical protein
MAYARSDSYTTRSTKDTETGDEFQIVDCMCCGKEAEISGGTTDKDWAEIRRGALACADVDGAADATENIKFSRYICPDCFMKDRDLCSFFNRCGCRMR